MVRYQYNSWGKVTSTQDTSGVSLATLNPDGHTSMCQDVLAGRPTEVELFAGTMLKIAEEEGLSLPVNAFLYERLKELETAED